MTGSGEGAGSGEESVGSRPADDPLRLCGRTIGTSYAIESLARVGGFSVVYRARHTIWNKPCAVKVFDGPRLSGVTGVSELREAFIQEGALLAELSSLSTSIVQAWDVGVTDAGGESFPYVVLEWLEGTALDTLLVSEAHAGRPRWTLQEVHGLLDGVAHALEIAHRRGIVHRDIKPENLFVVGTPRTPEAITKLLDFGVAKVMELPAARALAAQTGALAFSFTPAYGAPEQFDRSFGSTGPWTDVYALALVIVELLTGRRPLEGQEVAEFARSSCDPKRRPTPAAFQFAMPKPIEAVLSRALAVSPGDRYSSAGELWTSFTRAVQDDTLTAITVKNPESISLPGLYSPKSSPAPETQPSRRRQAERKARLAIAGAIAIGTLAAGTTALVATSPSGERDSLAAAVRHVARAGSLNAALASIEQRCPADMARIPAGQFYMGSDARDATEAEKPSFHVTLDAFCLDRTEVTLGAYRACSSSSRCRPAARDVSWPELSLRQKTVYGPLCNAHFPDRGNHPVNCIDHAMASGFCEARGARLPTEAEWEYAARGPDGRIYPWGDDAPSAKLLNGCGRECVIWGRAQGETLLALHDEDDGWPHTAPVGSFQGGRSRYGPVDLAGNVWEWVADWHAPYTTDAKRNPRGAPHGERRVIRGGAWNGSYANWLRPSFRYGQDPRALSHGIGFRCARSLKKPRP